MPASLIDLIRDLVPLPSVFVGLVLAHNDDDTSTIQLPTGQGVTDYAANVATGSIIRARGTQVPVGRKAFVRAASAGSGPVVETQAPDGDPVEVIIGEIVLPAPPTPPSAPVVTAGTVTTTTQPLSWTEPVSGTGPFTYRVARRVTSAGGAYITVASGLAALAYTVPDLAGGTSYDYAVTPVGVAGAGPAGTVTATTAAGTTTGADTIIRLRSATSELQYLAAYQAADPGVVGLGGAWSLADYRGTGNEFADFDYSEPSGNVTLSESDKLVKFTAGTNPLVGSTVALDSLSPGQYAFELQLVDKISADTLNFGLMFYSAADFDYGPTAAYAGYYAGVIQDIHSDGNNVRTSPYVVSSGSDVDDNFAIVDILGVVMNSAVTPKTIKVYKDGTLLLSGALNSYTTWTSGRAFAALFQ